MIFVCLFLNTSYLSNYLDCFRSYFCIVLILMSFYMNVGIKKSVFIEKRLFIGLCCKYSRVPPFSAFAAMNTPSTPQPCSFEPHLFGVWPIFSKPAYKRCFCISVSPAMRRKRAHVFGHISSVKCKWRTNDIVSLLSPPCLLVAEHKSWLAVQAEDYGVIVCVLRDAQSE